MKQFEYDISVIIPVYNTEKYIDACLSSIINQSYNFKRIEVILINDGSIDKSKEKCEEYSQKYPNIKLINQENSGVSVARNKGIAVAKGKYIMILDSDDYISKNAIKNVICFFDKHYEEIDIVVYPIYNDNYGNIKKHQRYDSYDKGTNVYDIEEYIYLNQSTVNIVIKNQFEKNHFYDVNMKLSEDQNFDTEIIMQKKKIGYVANAIYYYRRYGTSVSATRNNPYYCFDDVMKYNENLLKKYKENGKVPKYIQNIVIGTLKWRMATDQLLPYHYKGKEYEKAKKRILNILEKIDVDVIANCPTMSLLHKGFFLKLKEKKIEITKDDKENYQITCDGVVIEKINDISCLINKFSVKNNHLLFMGSLMTIIFEYLKPELIMEQEMKDGQKIREPIPLFESNNSFVGGTLKTNIIYGFDLSIDLKEIKKISFYALINETEIPICFQFTKFASDVTYNKKIRLKINKNHISITRKNIINKTYDIIEDVRNTKLKQCTSFGYKFLSSITGTKKKIWLYSDKAENYDNAYFQFKHDNSKNDGIDRYYIYNDKLENVKQYFTPEELKKVVLFRSLKHKILFLKASKIITSFSDLQVYCPFNKGIAIYRNKIKYELVYLQHGILHANLLKMYAKEFTEISKFVISSEFERTNLINKYHYKQEDLIETGMSRMKENSGKYEKAKNKILYAPSWRKYLIGNLVKNKRELRVNEFLNSTYFKENYKLLHSKKLNSLLKKNKLVLEFKLHPIFKEYAKYFDLDGNDNVLISFKEHPMDEYKLFITDFSSFQFDFIKLKRPIMYFLPDIDEFNAGLHTYRSLDLPYEEAFGDLFYTEAELIQGLEKLINNHFKTDKVYKKRMEDFFFEIKEPCERIYQSLICSDNKK